MGSWGWRRVTRVALVGAGLIGRALLSGLLEAGYPALDLLLVTRRVDQGAHLANRYGVALCDLETAAETADIVVIAVKPQDITPVLETLRTATTPATLVLSLSAGVSIDAIERAVPEGTAVVRAMPNTALVLRESMTLVAGGKYATTKHLTAVEQLFGYVGRVMHLREQDFDAATALSGSGPAYLFYMAEALIDGGVRLGLSADRAVEMVAQTLFGAATLLRQTGEAPQRLRSDVSSPGGTTEAAVGHLDKRDMRGIIHEALEVARDRSVALRHPPS
jgi:pyrroline-5-carboxylate reductase